MPLIQVALISFAVLTAYSCAGNLYIAMRKKKDLLYLLFSLLCLVIVEAIIANIILMHSFDREGIVLAARLRIAGVSVFIALFTWFVSIYTGFRPWTFLFVFTAEVLVLMIARLVHPDLLGFDVIYDPGVLVFSWGERVSYFRAVSNFWIVPYVANGLVMSAFSCAAAVFQYRRGERRRALGLLTAVAVLTALSLVDMVNGLRGVNALLVNDFGWLAMILLLNLVFTEDGIRAGEIRRSLQESERTFRALFESDFRFIALLDSDGRILDINESACLAMGLAKSSAMGIPFPGLLSVEGAGDISGALSRASAGEDRRLDAVIVEQAGAQRIYDFTFRRVADVNERTRFLVAEGLDITEQYESRRRIIRQNEELMKLNNELAGTLQELHETNREFEALNRDLQRSERDLRASELKLKAIIEHSTGLFYSHNVDDVITYVSPQSRTFFDCEPEEAMTSWHEFITENPMNRIGLELTRRAIETGEAQPPYILEIKTRKGRTLWVEVHESPVVENGRTAMVVGVLTDISDRKWAEDLLRIQRDLGIALGEAVSVKDAMDIILRAALRVRGFDCGGIYLRDDAAGGYALVSHVNLSEEFAAKASWCPDGSTQARIIEGGVSVYGTYESIVNPQDGCRLSENLLGFGMIPVLHEGKIMAAFTMASKTNVVIAEDTRSALEGIAGRIGIVLSRLQAMEALRESESRFKDMADMLPLAIFETDPLGVCLYANRFAFELYGYSREEFDRGLNVLNLILPEEKETAIANMAAVMKGGGTGHHYTAVRADGSLFPVMIRSNPVLRNGVFSGFRGAIIDLTDIKRAENEIRQSLREKDVLIREIHHRVKNNLQLVMSLLNLESSRNEELTGRALFQDSINRVRSMALIHERIYRSDNFSRIDMGPYVRELVSELVTIYAVDRSLVECAITVSDVTLGVDMAVPCALLINEIVTNAFSHGRSADGILRLDIRFSRSGGDYVLSISDAGPGVDPDRLKAPGPATMGMQLITALSRQLSARMSVESDGGTRYVIEFEEREGAASAIDDRKTASAGWGPEGRGSVLIVEDEMVTALYMKRVLEKAGFPVSAVAVSGEDAVEKVKADPPGLVFMDILLAGKMNGLEASNEIWKSMRVPVVFLTANTDHAVREAIDAMKLKHDCSYVVKPVDPGMILSLAGTHLGPPGSKIP